MNFITKPKSEIYLLAFDKRLTYLRHGNDFTKSDVVKTVADYDGENKIIIDDLREWHPCKKEELDRVRRGRTIVTTQSDDGVTIGDIFENEYDEANEDIDLLQTDLIEYVETTTIKPTEQESEDELIRKLFPETWIFEKLESGNESTSQKIFKTVDSITTWMISAFSVNNEYGIALAPTQELVVKQDFFVKINLPYSIRYTEVLRVDVLVFNYLETKEAINVIVTLGNFRTWEIQLVEYKNQQIHCEAIYTDKFNSSQMVSVPANSVRSVPFYIRSKPNSNVFENAQRAVHIKVVGAVKNKKVVDGIVKKLIVEPVGIKSYAVNALSFNMKGDNTTHSQMTSTVENITRINVIVTGDMIGDAMKIDEMVKISFYDCLEQRTSKLKRNSDIYRYLKKKNKSPDKSFILKQSNEVKDRFLNYNYPYKNNGWYRAHLVDALATASASDALTGVTANIEEHFEYLKSLQAENGSFSNVFIKDMFPLNVDYLEEIYFSTAYCLVPFLKHKSQVSKNYENVITKAIEYLEKYLTLSMKFQSRSLSAYVSALYYDTNTKSKNLLQQANKYPFERGNKTCYKLRSHDTLCDIILTSYIAMTLLTLNQIKEAEPVINYLINHNLYFGAYHKTFFNAILTEPIVEMGIAKMSDNETNLEIDIQNDRGMNRSLKITENNSQVPFNVLLPKYSKGLKVTVSGYGFCTLTSITEHVITIGSMSSSFNVAVTTKMSPNIANEIFVTMCAKYHQQDIKDDIMNVMYEVNMPSGYVYSEIVNLDNIVEIKQVTEAREKTLIVIYYNNFKLLKNYCVEIKAKKIHEVKKIQNSGVKVYDFNNKETTTLAFYKLQYDECQKK